jgi:hypothetical protein
MELCTPETSNELDYFKTRRQGVAFGGLQKFSHVRRLMRPSSHRTSDSEICYAS